MPPTCTHRSVTKPILLPRRQLLAPLSESIINGQASGVVGNGKTYGQNKGQEQVVPRGAQSHRWSRLGTRRQCGALEPIEDTGVV
jgi:hypothetical protein